MKTRVIFFYLVFGLLFTVAWGNFTSAIERQQPGQSASAPVRKLNALNTQECKKLGGNVELFVYVCASSMACRVTDQRGGNHVVCINAK